jgi:hypothetical protein
MQFYCNKERAAVEASAMPVPLDPSSRPPNRGPCLPLSVGLVYKREAGRVVRAEVLAIVDDVVARRPFWALLERLALRAEWLRATFALASRPTCCGVAPADGTSPVAGSCGTWQSAPRLTLIVAGKNITEDALDAVVTACLVPVVAQRDEDPFPRWQPGDPWLPVFWERAC